MPTLTIQLPGLPPVSHVLKDETTTIGRMKGNTIVIEDSSISLMHAKITRKDGEFYLKDLNSTNGTIINGQAIAEAKLRDLDRVRFAEIPAQFQADAVPVGVVAQAVPALAPQPIQAVNPLRAISSEAPNPLPRLNAPAPAIPAAVTPVPPPAPPRGERSPGAAWGMFTQFVPMVSGAAALAVLCVFGWRFLQVQQNDRVRSLVQEAAAVGPIQGHLAERRDLPIAKAAPEKVNPPRASRSAVAQNSAQPARVENLVRELKSEDVTDRRRASAALHNLGAEAK
ncbi:MAG TPA: FHA domain-containing protein, partial [Candidatus Dormibacteraeota bacterium]|nr:FHA domain-containing protein [Candidatus Dormibacteraeota bacterium]